MTRICEKCGAPLREGVKFCTKCGHPVTAQPQPSPQPRPQQPSRLNPQYRPKANPQPESRQLLRNSTFGLVMLGLVVMIVSAVAVVKFIDYRYDKQDVTHAMASGQEEGGGGMKDADGSNPLLLTEEALKYLKEHPVEVTPENSPGNPDFIEVTYNEEEYANAPTRAALVSREKPEVDFPELGVHVNMKSWNLNYEQDSLIVKRLPDKVDETTGMILHSYDYSLVSKQHNFLTDVEFTAPVQGDPDAFAGFVTYNKATGRWEEVYCELSEDRRTFTAHLPHFTEGAALETVKEEGMEAIEKFKIDGKSIFVQLKNEMKPKYKETQHYLYPVSIARTVDLKKFFNKQQKNQLEIINRIIVEGGNIPEKDAMATAMDWFGYGSKVSDVAGNVGGAVGVAKEGGYGFKKVSNGVLSDVSSSCFLVGYAALALEIANQIAEAEENKDKDILTIVDEKKVGIASTLLSYIGLLSSIAGEGTILFATIGGGVAAGTVGTAVAVISAIVFAYTASGDIADWMAKQVFDKKFPLGEVPTSITEAALQCYMQDCAHSEGYLKNQLSAWEKFIGGVDNPKAIDSASVYVHHPQMLLDHDPKNWLNAYDCLLRKYVDNPKKMFEAYDKMFETFVNAFWKEPKEVRKKYYRMACKKHIKVAMFKDEKIPDGTGGYILIKHVRTYKFEEAKEFEPLDPDPNIYKFSSLGKSEWKDIQAQYIVYAKVKKTSDAAWDALFQSWDEDESWGNREREFLANTYNNKIAFNAKYIKLLKYRVSPLLHDYYNKKRHESILEVRKMLTNQVLPLLNTRLTFYSNNLDDPNDIIKPTNYGVPFTPTFEFKCDKKAQFRPGNAYDVKPCFPLVLKPNEINPVLLETTVYHYLMYDCPEEVETNIQVLDKPLMARANWDSVTLVQDKHLAQTVGLMQGSENNEYGGWGGYLASVALDNLQKNIDDTKIPVEFSMTDDGGRYYLKTLFTLPTGLEMPNVFSSEYFDQDVSEAIRVGQTCIDVPQGAGDFSVKASGRSNNRRWHFEDESYLDENYDVNMTIKGYINEKGEGEYNLNITIKYDASRKRGEDYAVERRNIEMTFNHKDDFWIVEGDLIDSDLIGGNTANNEFTFDARGKIHQKGTKDGVPFEKEVDGGFWLHFECPKK